MDQHHEYAARAADRERQEQDTAASGRVRHDIWARLAPAGTLRIPVRARFGYDTADPYAVRVSFCLPNRSEVTWIFARDLLADGLDVPVGAGDIRVAPKHSLTEWILHIMLTPPSGSALIEVRSARVRAFLRATERLVPRGAEKLDIEAFLGECLSDD